MDQGGVKRNVGLSFMSIIEEERHYNILSGLMEGREYSIYCTIYYTIYCTICHMDIALMTSIRHFKRTRREEEAFYTAASRRLLERT